MSLRYEVPKTLTATDMFIWWCKNKIRKRRHLKILYQNSNSRPAILVSNNGDELKWLRKNVLVLAEQIEGLEKIDNNKYYFTKITQQIYDKKSEIYEANNRIKHLEQVDNNNSQIVMSEADFKKVLYSFNSKVRDDLINNASVINMKSYLGYLYISRVDRNSGIIDSKSSRMPNWLESNKLKAKLISEGIQIKDKNHPDGKKWIVYFDDDYYLRFTWTKNRGACRVHNHIYYSFQPSKGQGGSRKQLSNANRKNDFLSLTYTSRDLYARKKKEK